MKADAIAISKLYDTLNKGYVIPAYQRPYAWNPTKAIDLLDSVLEDALAGAKLTSLGTVLLSPVSISPSHPHGNSKPTSRAPNTIWEVVDGQQRLTVFAIIGYALEKRAKKLASQGLLYSPTLEFGQLFSTSRTKTGNTVPVLIRDEDNFDNGYKSEIANLLDAFLGHQALVLHPSSRLHETLSTVKDYVATKLTKKNFATLCEHLLTRCQVIQVEADDQDTAFRMFEPLNSTSEPLTAFEVYRSKVLAKVKPAEKFDETFELLDYENTKRDEVIKRSNTLIFAMAQAYSGERPRLHFLPLKKYLDKQVNKAFVDKLELGARFLRTVWLEQTATDKWFDEDTKSGIRFLRAARHDVVLPLLLRYFLTKPDRLPAVVKAVVAFFGLWRPAFTTGGLPDVYRALLTSGSSDDMSLVGGTLKSAKDLRAYFRGEFANKMSPVPPGKSLEQFWMDGTTQKFLDYNDLGTLCRLFIFLEIGSTLKSNLVPDDPWTSLDDIEHIWPASGTPVPASVHRIGNLTFLPPKINRSLKAASWKHKREVYALLGAATKPTTVPKTYIDGHPIPKAVRNYLKDPKSDALLHLQPLALSKTWNEAKIVARGDKMLKSIWHVLHDTWLK